MLEVNTICGTYQTYQKKARGYKNEQIFFLQFWFCAISETTKSCLTFKSIPKNLLGPSLSFESISVVISQKLSELDRFNIGPFFCPSTVARNSIIQVARGEGKEVTIFYAFLEGENPIFVCLVGANQF